MEKNKLLFLTCFIYNNGYFLVIFNLHPWIAKLLPNSLSTGFSVRALIQLRCMSQCVFFFSCLKHRRNDTKYSLKE